jgi:hypothetical protein
MGNDRRVNQRAENARDRRSTPPEQHPGQHEGKKVKVVQKSVCLDVPARDRQGSNSEQENKARDQARLHRGTFQPELRGYGHIPGVNIRLSVPHLYGDAHDPRRNDSMSSYDTSNLHSIHNRHSSLAEHPLLSHIEQSLVPCGRIGTVCCKFCSKSVEYEW